MTPFETTRTPGVLRVRYMSDLHLEFTKYRPDHLPSADEDLVVLAGDIGTGTAGIRWAQRVFPNTPVIYVLGNHEFYGYSFQHLVREARAACEHSNVVLLEDEVFRYRGVRFLGATLWTDFLIQGPEFRFQAMEACQSYINDYRHIRSDGRALLAQETLARHEATLAWLRRELNRSDETTVVVTHHGPCLAAKHPAFPIDAYSNVFFSDLAPELFRTVHAWIFGHTHSSLNTIHEGARLLSNQRGYPGEVKTPFDWGKILEITLPKDADPADGRLGPAPLTGESAGGIPGFARGNATYMPRVPQFSCTP